ncbi:MAG: hypothetical protein LBG45_00725, partial [Dysgonamonadaceae bacterium]|nr:hypothetical protein [Dysgonamonadaceae bacterium]
SQQIRRICPELTAILNRSAGSVRNRLRLSTDPPDLFGIDRDSQQIRRICSELTAVLNRSAGSVRNWPRFSTDPPDLSGINLPGVARRQ